MTAIISRVAIVGGHDGRAEIEVEVTYTNGGTATVSLDEEACMASLDRAGVHSLEELQGKPWSVVLPAMQQQASPPQPCQLQSSQHQPSQQAQQSQQQQARNHA